ncbi:MAG: phosphotransferase [Meiothermus sp.]|uniref:phosphotransferase family protein n=1 Tax=Meiothermus sp. TaxID=1955249 RepID=UPI00261A1268|nr:phosphotransferase [Meiothermus sp.]MCS7058511.1 phosphotransferase [Meiothermus sp.]MDW8091042.1 phosphotransferase [Meiothermus sp.]MDW8480931.1 phosphotransferase [Meiothermus sp.]
MPTRIGQGREAEVLTWADGYVIKLFWPEYGQADALHEAQLAQQAWLLGAPVPRVVDVLRYEGRWGIVMEWAKGVPMSEFIRDNPSLLHQAAHMLADLHLRLHARPAGQMPSQRLYLAQRIETSWLPRPLQQALLERLAQLPDGSALCHGDLHPENVLVGRQGVYAVDWPLATRGNPLADLARTALLLLYSELPIDWPGRRTFLSLRQIFLQAYLERYQADWRELQPWMPIVAAARLRDHIPEEEARLIDLIVQGLKTTD